jgi:hypothetical protein
MKFRDYQEISKSSWERDEIRLNEEAIKAILSNCLGKIHDKITVFSVN